MYSYILIHHIGDTAKVYPFQSTKELRMLTPSTQDVLVKFFKIKIMSHEYLKLEKVTTIPTINF